jgi:hypothetical protein
MTVIRPPGSFTSYTGSSQPTPEWLGPTVWLTVILALIAWGTVSTFALLSSLFFSAAAGLIIGWIRQAVSRRSRFGESFISALLGGSLTRDPSRLVFLDLFVRTLAAYAVGLVFAKFGIMNADASNPLLTLVIAGAGGGPDTSRMLFMAILLLLVAMLIGACVVMAIGSWAGIVLKVYLFDASAIAKLAAIGATKGALKDAVIAQQEYGNWRIKLGRSAAKGAVTGVLVGMLLIIVGLNP